MKNEGTAVEQNPCPNCGYCPHCGRSNQQPIIYYQYPPPFGYWQIQPQLVTTTLTWVGTDNVTYTS